MSTTRSEQVASHSEEQRLEFVRRIALFRLETTETMSEAYRLAEKLVPSDSQVFLSLVDSDMQKILLGPSDEQALLSGSLLDMEQENNLCYHTIQSRQTLDVADTRADDRFIGAASVKAGLVRSYCGIPMFARGEIGDQRQLEPGDAGYSIGAFCVYSSVPHSAPFLDSHTHEILLNLARLVSREIEIQGHRWRERREEELQQIAADAAAWAAQRPLANRFGDDAVFQQLSWAISEALDCDTCLIIALNEDTSALNVLAASGEASARQQALAALETASVKERAAILSNLRTEGPHSLLTKKAIQASVHAAFASPSAQALYCLPLFSTEGRLEILVQVTRATLLSGFYRAETALIGTIGRAAHSELVRQRLSQPVVAQLAFADRVSHGLRTPLHIVQHGLGFVHDACQSGDMTKVQRHLKVIDNSLSTLETVIAGICELQALVNGSDIIETDGASPQFIRTSSGSLDLTSSRTCSVSDLVKMAIENAVSQQGLHGDVQFEMHLLRGAAEPSVLANQTDLRRIAYQLISNALKFTSRGSIVVTIRAADESCELCVADTGCGMSNAYQREGMLRPFDQEALVASEGMGIGLSITKLLIDRLRGTLDISSVRDQGTRARVSLPIVSLSSSDSVNPVQRLLISRDAHGGVQFTPVSATAVTRSLTTPGDQASDHGSRSSSMSRNRDFDAKLPFRVLLVDDNIIARRVLVQTAKRMGLPWIEAIDGLDAVRQFKLTRPLCVVMDQSMPNLSGRQAAALMRAHEKVQEWPRSHIMIFSAFDPPEPLDADIDEWRVKGSMRPQAMQARLLEIKQFMAKK